MRSVRALRATLAFARAALLVLVSASCVRAAPEKTTTTVAKAPPAAPVNAVPATAPAPVKPAPAAVAPAPAPRPVKLTPSSSGPELYQVLCAPCHAVDGSGGAADHAPSLISSTFLESASDTFLRNAIANGRPGTSMGAYGKARGGPLDDRALARLVTFVRSRGPVHRPVHVTVSQEASPERGQVIYGQICKTCHGDPENRGEAVHLVNPGFLKEASDGFLKDAVLRGRPGTKMVSFTATLKESQIDDVIAYVRSLARQPPPRSLLPAPTGHEPMVLNPQGKDPQFALREGRFASSLQVRDALAAHRRIIILDARPPSEWMQTHIPGAVSVPYHDLRRLEEVPKDVWVVAYCACPHHLSGAVVDELRQRGHERAVVLDEGINEWHRRGYPIVTAPGVQRPPGEPTAAPDSAPFRPAPTPVPLGAHSSPPTPVLPAAPATGKEGPRPLGP